MMSGMKKGMVIAAVRYENDFENALKSKTDFIFDLSPDILSLEARINSAHKAGKKLFIHIDLANGIGKDKSGILYAKDRGVDGIISTRVNIIKTARECGLFTVQRFFIVDSHSVDTTVEAAKTSKPDMIEVMPGIMTKVISDLKNKLDIPIIAGGLIETSLEAKEVFESGGFAISTGKTDLWN